VAKHRTSTDNVTTVDVFNTCSWKQSDLVILPKTWNPAGNIVFNSRGEIVPTQRLSTGEIGFIARNIPPLAAERFILKRSALLSKSPAELAKATPPVLSNYYLTVEIDEATGAIASLKHRDISGDLVAGKGGLGLNDYFYVAGRDPKEPKRNGPVTITVKEAGPFVASLVMESDAPGCNKLTREVRLVGSLDRVDIIDTIDKQKIYKQEGVHLAFAFNVPKGVMRMDVPWGVVRPELGQLAGACKNYFTVQRWADVSNDKFGATLATVDAPLIEVGAITNDPRGGVGWIKKLDPTTTLYSYVMNNYWETNYKASQEGPTVFRYSIKPHGKFDPAEAAKFSVGRSQRLIAVPVGKIAPFHRLALNIEPEDVIVTAFKPSEDGQARILRLYNAGEQSRLAKIRWAKPAPKTVLRSNLAEEQLLPLTGAIRMAAHEFVTLRVSLPE